MPKKVSKAKRSGVPAVVKGISDVGDLDENHVALFYGKSGRGKTKTAATFPAPLLFLDINNEKGLKTVRTVPGLKVARITTWDEFEDLYWWLREGQNFKTIVLDQITGLQDLGMANIRAKLKKPSGDLFSQKNWGQLSGDMKTWLSHYRELGALYNVVFLAHERAFDTNDEDGDNDLDPSVTARVMPSVGDFVAGACDIIGQNFIRVVEVKGEKGKPVRKVEYCMRLGPHPLYITKIRRPAEAGPLPAFIVNPSYTKLVAIENGEEIESKRKLTKKRRKVNGTK
jgi:hypothetical protein